MCQAFDVDYFFFFFLLENFGDLDVISRSQGCKKKKAKVALIKFKLCLLYTDLDKVMYKLRFIYS